MDSIIRLARRCLLLAGLAAGACAYDPNATEPIPANLAWFDYIAAHDIQESCGPDAPETYRLVYNADYPEQARSYDIVALPNGRAALTVRVRGPAVLNRPIPLTDPLAPWRSERQETHISAPDVVALRRALIASGLTERPPVGLELDSRNFYWLAAACLDGHFHYTAWDYPSPRWKRLRFPPLLRALDGTGVPFREPSADRTKYPESIEERLPGERGFRVVVGPAGLRDARPLFGR